MALDANQCAGLDTLQVLTPPLLDLPSTLSCAGDSQLIVVPPVYLHTQWANGVANDSLWINQPGAYPMFVVDSLACVQRDTVQVGLLPPANLLPPNSYHCPGKPTTLTVPGPYTQFQWSSGDTTASAWVMQSGIYLVTALDTGGCAISDFTVLADYAVVPVDLGPDTSYCQNNVLALWTQQPYASYTWSDGSHGPSMLVNVVGDYHVAALDANCCESLDTVHVGVRPSPLPPLVSSPGPHTICAGSSVQLQASPGYTSYLWSNGTNGPSTSISTAGAHFEAGFNQVGCSTHSAIVMVMVDTVPVPTVMQFATMIYSSDSSAAYQWNLNGVPVPGATGHSYYPPGPGVYSVTVFDSLGCHATSPNAFVWVPIGVSEPGKAPVCRLSPNPSTGQVLLDIDLHGLDEVAHIRLLDPTGRVLRLRDHGLPGGAGQVVLDLSDIAVGWYTVQIQSTHGTFHDKVVLQR